MIALRVVADGKLSGVGRNSVVVVAAVGKTGWDDCGIVAADCEAFDMTIAVEQERSAVMRPVRSFEASFRKIMNAPDGGRIRVHNFQNAVQSGLTRRRRELAELDFREQCLF